MFKQVIALKGFWKSVMILSIVYMIVLFLIIWGFTGFNPGMFQLHPARFMVFILGGFIVGFSMTYGKYWGKLKENKHKK
jgi:hypothetical protein